jgi:DNA-binding GntR family transcriptional regulator
MRLTYLAYKHGQPRRDTCDEHTSIVQALMAHDALAAEAAMRQYIARAKDRTLARL